MSALCVSSTTLNSQRVTCDPIDFGVTLRVTPRSVDDCVVVAFGPACAIAGHGVAASISAATVSHPAILTLSLRGIRDMMGSFAALAIASVNASCDGRCVVDTERAIAMLQRLPFADLTQVKSAPPSSARDFRAGDDCRLR